MQGVSSLANLTTDVWQQMPLPNFQYLIYQEKPNMLFMLMASDVADSTEARLAARSAHLARLEKLAEAGRLVLAGPCPLPEGETGFSGSLIVADFASLDEAEEWAGQDPYVEAGVYAEILIRPFKKVLPA